jgi:hypothetical protein
MYPGGVNPGPGEILSDGKPIGANWHSGGGPAPTPLLQGAKYPARANRKPKLENANFGSLKSVPGVHARPAFQWSQLRAKLG